MSPAATPCVVEPDLWFDPARVEDAIAACQTCPLVEQCRQLGERETWGVWGGVDRTARAEQPANLRAANAARVADRAARDAALVAAFTATWSTAEVAARFGVSDRTVQRAARAAGVTRPTSTMCGAGLHERTPDNTRTRPSDGVLVCRDCSRDRVRAYRARQSERTAA